MTAPQQANLLPPEFTQPERPVRARKGEDPEELFAGQCRAYRLPSHETQHRFAKVVGRQWRFDFAFPDYKLAIEIEGLVVRRLWVAKLEGGGPIKVRDRIVNVADVESTTVVLGRHASITGFREDCVKYATAAALGWVVVRFEQKMVKSREAIEMTMRALAARGWKSEGL